MSVSTISYQPTITKQTSQSLPVHRQGNFAAIFNSALNNQVTKYATIEDKSAHQYDIHNATFEEMKIMASQLYEAGQIDLLHLGMLTLDLTPLARKLGFSPENQFLTPADKSGRRDWIAEWKARAEQQLKLGNTTGYQGELECLEILHLLER